MATHHDEPDPHRPDAGAASAATASPAPAAAAFSGAHSAATTLMLDRSLDFSWENLTYRVRVAAGAFFSFLLMVVLIANTGTSFGLVAASVFQSADVAMAVVPLTMLPMMIVAGLFANTDRLDPAWLWLNYVSFPRYGFVGLFLVEFEHLDVICPLSDTTCPYKTGAQVIQFYGFENYTWGMCAGALSAFIVGLRVLGAISLHLQGKSRRGNLPFTENLEAREMSPRALASARSPAAGDRAPPGGEADAADADAEAPAFKGDE